MFVRVIIPQHYYNSQNVKFKLNETSVIDKQKLTLILSHLIHHHIIVYHMIKHHPKAKDNLKRKYRQNP
jgi:hypothetical protein